jgi:methylated-DNA-protein-cysteine methyltransferase-like protein
MTPNKQAEKVYSITRSIPKGRVATYKQLAQLSGVSNPRQIGYLMHINPYEGDVPCHRVVSSTGKVAKTFAFGGLAEQQKRLEKEGVIFNNGKINLVECLWDPFKN